MTTPKSAFFAEDQDSSTALPEKAQDRSLGRVGSQRARSAGNATAPGDKTTKAAAS